MSDYKSFFKQTEVYFSIFDNMRDEIFIYDLEARLIYVNKAGELSEGYRLEDTKGKSLFEVYNFENDIRLDRSPCYIALTERRNVDDMVCIYHSGDKLNKKEISSRLIYDGDEVVGVFTIQHDIEDIYDLVDENLSLQHLMGLQRADYLQHVNDPFADIPSFGEAMDQCLEKAKKAVQTDSAVMLFGPDGSGRSAIARAIHDSGARAGKPFITFNCSHFSEEVLDNMIFGAVYNMHFGEGIKGILEQADGGTLYLEDITSLPDSIQNKLLIFIESGGKFHKTGGYEELESNVRIICSCKESALEIIKQRMLQMKLFYCLSVVHIQVPSLYERRTEIPQLIEYYIDLYNKRFHKNVRCMDETATSYCKVFDWTGNIRQLSKCIEAAFNMLGDSDTITVEMLPANMFYGIKNETTPLKNLINTSTPSDNRYGISYDSRIANLNRQKVIQQSKDQERMKVIQALQKFDGNITHAAEYLGISRQLLYYRIKKYDIKL